MSSVLVVIPARAGSRGVPHKNIREVGGKPLLAWSIEHGLTVPDALVVVSTDSEEYARIAAEYGAFVVMRPPELSTDSASTDATLLHVVDQFLKHEFVVLLQPTVPVRRRDLTFDCLSVARETAADAVLTAYPLHFVWWRETEGRPEQAWKHGEIPEQLKPAWRTQCPRRPMRQEMSSRELMWHEDGSVYVTRTEFLLKTGCRVGGHIEVVRNERTVDIDTEEDLIVADALLRARQA